MTKAQEVRKAHQGQNVGTLRRWRGLTQGQLADMLNMMQSEVSIIESKRMVDPKTLQQIAQVLKVDVNFLETFVPEDVLGVYSDNKDVTNNSTATVNDNATENETTITGSVKDYQNIINNNSIPFSELAKYFDEIRRQDKKIADLRILLVKHGIDLPEEASSSVASENTPEGS